MVHMRVTVLVMAIMLVTQFIVLPLPAHLALPHLVLLLVILHMRLQLHRPKLGGHTKVLQQDSPHVQTQMLQTLVILVFQEVHVMMRVQLTDLVAHSYAQQVKK